MTRQEKEYNHLKKAMEDLQRALRFLKEAEKDEFYFAGITKSFEVCMEYAWKYFKAKAIQQGLNAYSPAEAIKLAGRITLIDDVEKWLDFLENRNLSVHNYFGLTPVQYLNSVQDFYKEGTKLLRINPEDPG